MEPSHSWRTNRHALDWIVSAMARLRRSVLAKVVGSPCFAHQRGLEPCCRRETHCLFLGKCDYEKHKGGVIASVLFKIRKRILQPHQQYFALVRWTAHG